MTRRPRLTPPAAAPANPTRREFILGGIKVGLAFLAAPSLAASPWSGRHPAEACLTRPPRLDESLGVLAAFLARYSPPPGAIPSSGPWRAAYDLIEWDGSPAGAKFYRRNRTIGRMVVRRSDAPGGRAAYALDYAIRIRGFESTLRSEMTCGSGRLPDLLAWECAYANRRLSPHRLGSALREKGVRDEAGITITSAAGQRRFPSSRPVATQWAVLDCLRGGRADSAEAAPIEFDLLHDLTSFRPRQILSPFGRVEVRLGARIQTLHGFVQLGEGTAPTHYWIDGTGRPLLVSGGLLSLALASVET